jgi:hypothetical protein
MVAVRMAPIWRWCTNNNGPGEMRVGVSWAIICALREC